MKCVGYRNHWTFVWFNIIIVLSQLLFLSLIPAYIVSVNYMISGMVSILTYLNLYCMLRYNSRVVVSDIDRGNKSELFPQQLYMPCISWCVLLCFLGPTCISPIRASLYIQVQRLVVCHDPRSRRIHDIHCQPTLSFSV